ncbi:MAG: HRDC domain-containing protein, partial [Candidatus Latescibacterota bacterium]
MIDTPEALRTLVAQIRRCPSVALDTEFVWESTYYPRLGLVQLGLDDGTCHLVDAVALPDLAPLAEIIAAADLPKILHDAPQDLTILRRATGASPRNVFDTRCAAGLAGLSSTSSLLQLASTVLGVELDKTASRTNWLQRPLSPAQARYAVEDVRCLPPLRDALLARIRRLGRESWLREELLALDDPRLYEERDPREQYQRIKGAGRATPRELAVLRELAAWREEEARRSDRPRGRILSDDVLLHLARRKPRTL